MNFSPVKMSNEKVTILLLFFFLYAGMAPASEQVQIKERNILANEAGEINLAQSLITDKDRKSVG